jgi:transposase-like protein
MKDNGCKSKRFPTKIEAGGLRLLLVKGTSMAQLRKQHGASDSSPGKLRRGTIHNENHRNSIHRGTNNEFSVLQEENLRLKQENRILRQQNVMLRKSIGTFSTRCVS